MDSYQYLLNIKYNTGIISYLVLGLIMIVFILACTLESCDNYVVYSVFNENYITINVPIDNSDSVTQGTNLVIDNVEYQYTIVETSDLLVKDYINYQIYKLQVKDLKLINNQVVKITFYFNEEKIIKKIIKLIF